jgi:hypothetical protein
MRHPGIVYVEVWVLALSTRLPKYSKRPRQLGHPNEFESTILIQLLHQNGIRLEFVFNLSWILHKLFLKLFGVGLRGAFAREMLWRSERGDSRTKVCNYLYPEDFLRASFRF